MPALNANALVTLATALVYMKVAAGKRDDQVHRLINAATDAAERYTRRRLAARAYTLVRPQSECRGSTKLVVPEWPVVSVSEIREYSADLTTFEVIPATDYDLDRPADDSNNGIVLRVSGGNWPARRLTKVTYTGGYGWDAQGAAYSADKVPFDLQEAVGYMVAYADEKVQEKVHIVQSAGAEGDTATYFLRDMPRESKAILDRYRREAFC